MAEDLAAGHHMKGDAAEAVGDADTDITRVLARGSPVVPQNIEVVVATDQVVGNAEDGGAELAVAVFDQGTVGMIDLVALIAARTQTCSARDGAGVGIVFHGPHLAGVISGADDVDAR